MSQNVCWRLSILDHDAEEADDAGLQYTRTHRSRHPSRRPKSPSKKRENAGFSRCPTLWEQHPSSPPSLASGSSRRVLIHSNTSRSLHRLAKLYPAHPPSPSYWGRSTPTSSLQLLNSKRTITLHPNPTRTTTPLSPSHNPNPIRPGGVHTYSTRPSPSLGPRGADRTIISGTTIDPSQITDSGGVITVHRGGSRPGCADSGCETSE